MSQNPNQSQYFQFAVMPFVRLSSKTLPVTTQRLELQDRQPWFRLGRKDEFWNSPRKDSNGSALRGKRAAVVLCSYYPSDPRPRRAAEALVNADMEVDLICLNEDGVESAEEIVNGVRVFRLPWRKTREGKLAYLKQYGRFLLSSFLFLTRQSLRKKYDLVHVHNMPDVLAFSALIPRLQGAKVILDLHDPMPELTMSIFGVESHHWLVGVLRTLERWSIRFADLALTPNIAFKNLFASRSCRSEKVQIVMNSPEEQIFDPARVGPEDEPRDDRNFRIMHHGTLVYRHGIDILVEAIARVRPELPGVCLDLYGSRTPFLEVVLERAKNLGVDDIVYYHGPKPQTEIARAIQRCDLGVIPNRRCAFTEINFPTRLFEYIAMNRPVIAPNTQGIRDYFSPKQLFMFEPGNVDDLSAKILSISSQKQKVQMAIESGTLVYHQNLWRRESVRFVGYVATLLGVRTK